MSTTKESEDLREVILARIYKPNSHDFKTPQEDLQIALVLDVSLPKIKLAMDEYFEARSMELLEWMAENKVDCDDTEASSIGNGKDFFYKGDWHTKEELFKNFL